MEKEDLKSSKIEIITALKRLEEILKKQDEFSDKESLDEIYFSLHTIVEQAKLSDTKSLSTLVSPMEQYLSDLVEKRGALTKDKSVIILSSLSMIDALLNDPILSVVGLKTNYETMKKQITESFAVKKETEENIIANSRFKEIFIEEANDLINQLEEKLLQLEGEPDDQKLVDNVFRIMHTLKGNSNMFGYKFLGEITHHLENIYDAIRGHKLEVNRSILDITLQCIDHFRNLIEDQDLVEESNKVFQESILNDIVEILDTGNKTGELEKEEQHPDNTGLKSLYIFFKPQANVFDDGSNPLYFVVDLNELGECLVIPVLSDLPFDESFNPQLCYTCWHIIMTTSETVETVAENFMFLHENSQPEIIFAGNDNFLKNEKLVKEFKFEAKSSSSLSLWIKDKTGHGQKHEDKKVTVSTATDSSIASIRVASSKIDLMMNLISELVTKQAELSMVAGNNDIPQLQALAESIESISRDLRDNAFSISLIPLEKSVLRFQRLVRDVSVKFGKKVNFVVEGKETELDKTIIEKIVDPIMHILRNSIDHGIETPEQRIKLGKPEDGTITLRAFPSGAHVIIEISDDGSGINMERVKQVAIKKGFMNANDDLSTNEMLKLICSPGFSTAENISEVSGRGVGMDVVSQKLSEIRGELDIHTEKNVGTTMTIKLPLTISIIDSLLVMIGSSYYLIPLSVVERCAEVKTAVITESTTDYLNLSGEFIPFIDLRKEFDITEERLDYQRLILVSHKSIVLALVVDQILGNYQAVLKSLGHAYRKQEIVSGASILGSGEVALVLDTNKIVQEFMATREANIETTSTMNMQIS